MRILFVTHYALPHMGGIEVAVDAMARELAGRGDEVAVVASAAGAAAGAAGGDGHRIVRVRAFNGAEERLGVPYPLFSPGLLGVLRREIARADVVHAHGFLYQSSVAALAMASRAAHRPARVLTEHVGHVPYSSRALDAAQAAAVATLGRSAARLAQGHVVFNATVADLLVRLAPGRRTAWILNGVDPERYRPAADAADRRRLRETFGWDERPRVLFAGRPVAKKGFDVALAAAAGAEGAYRLVVAGPEVLPAGVPAGVELLGRLAPERMAEAYRAADALLVPSHGEGLPLVAQEALASGLPVVMTDDPGYRETMAPGRPGVRLAARTPAAMGAAVAELLSDPGRRAEASVAAAGFARRTFSWGRAADEHLALYGDLAAARP